MFTFNWINFSGLCTYRKECVNRN